MVSALIVASGKTNSKTSFEPGKVIGSITAIERVAVLLQQAKISTIVVVCEEDDKIRKLCSTGNLTFLSSPPNGEMIDSIKVGLSYLQNKCTKALIVYVDIPMFSLKTIRLLMESEAGVCIPAYQGRWGHPILLGAEHFEEILSYEGEKGLRGALDAFGIKKQIIQVDDAGVRADIQRGSLFKELVPGHDAAKLRLSCRFGIGKERIFYDEEVHQLLSLIQELGSLSKACTYMGISLNKGRTMITTIEEQIQKPALKTQQGGKNGGYSHLTDEMKAMMKSYCSFCAEAEQTLEKLFQKYFLSKKDGQ